MEKKKKKINKFLYGYKMWVNYGQGWEYELFELTWKDMKERLKEYAENAPQWPRKWAAGRETNDKYKGAGV
jgi:phenolic acid decarboxylase